MPTLLQNWTLICNQDGYKAPEVVIYKLTGTVYNHPKRDRFPDGKEIITGLITHFNRVTLEVRTSSGTEYILGEPSAEQKEVNLKHTN